jgi:hypothetical protein
VSAVRYGSPAARLLLQVAGGAAQAEVVVTLHGEPDVVDAASAWPCSRRPGQARQAAGDLLRAAPRGPVRRIPTLTALINAVSVSAGVDEAVRTAGCSRLVVPAG